MTPAGWICECTNPACLFRFPAALDDERRLVCPVCAGPTVCWLLAPKEGEEGGVRLDPMTGPVVALLLDNIRSTYNVGSLLRTAEGAGIAHVHLCGITPRPDHPRVAKTGLGAEEIVPWSYHPNAPIAARRLLDEGWRLWSLETGARAEPIFHIHAQEADRVVLVVGNEVTGVDPALLDLSERIVCLPMDGAKRSLNVASAGAVAIYWLRYGKR
ncbi:MAG: TrmH family RNA methyltransferase [Chloroflexi bacterium]|nr:TrmH family RNA methyltransferase [Chloroflexota bacterium]